MNHVLHRPAYPAQARPVLIGCRVSIADGGPEFNQHEITISDLILLTGMFM